MEQKHIITPMRPMTITNEMIEDILVGCFEGGSNYWITEVICKDWKNTSYASDVITAGGTLLIYADEGVTNGMPVANPLDLGTMLNGIQTYFNAMGTKAVEFENMDAGDNDNILQFALFGELVYG